MSKSSTACAMSIETLLANTPENGLGGHGYMWTFTLVWTAPISQACESWSKVSAAMVAAIGFEGVRVFELHPGVDDRSHGLHVHCVTAKRFKVRLVRAVCSAFGWSCHVGAVRKTAQYICKYLHKATRAECLAGRRLWAAVGMKPCAWRHTGVFKEKGRGRGKKRRYWLEEVKVVTDRRWANKSKASRTKDLELRSLRSAAWRMALERRRAALREKGESAPANAYRTDYGADRAAAQACYLAMFAVAGSVTGAGRSHATGTSPNLDYMGTFFDSRNFWPREWLQAS